MLSAFATRGAQGNEYRDSNRERPQSGASTFVAERRLGGEGRDTGAAR